MTDIEWPKTAMLVNQLARHAYGLSYVEDRTFRKQFVLGAGSKERAQALNYTAQCQVCNAFYLAGVRIHSSQGVMPKARLSLFIDGVIAVKESLAFFLKETSPGSPGIPWIKGLMDLFPVTGFSEKPSVLDEQLGYFLTNGMRLEVDLLDLEPLQDPTTLEIEVLMAEYYAGATSGPVEVTQE